MKNDDKYLDPKTNPFIKVTGDDDGNPRPPEDKEEEMPIDDLIPCDLSKKDDFEAKVQAHIGKVDEWLICADGVDEFRFKIKKSESGLYVFMPDGTQRTLADLSEEEKKIVESNFSDED
jgi:hypothetical protein